MVGGIRPSAGVVLPLLPPALLHYTINRRKLQAVRQKICAKKSEDVGGVCPARHWFALPLWKTQWGACPDVAGAAGVSDTRRGACPVGRLPTLPLACCLAPYPPTPFPGGEGGDPKFISPGGFAPGTPAFNRLRHSQSLPSRYPAGAGGVAAPLAALGFPAPGERTISNAAVACDG